jgi:hypothetical protein
MQPYKPETTHEKALRLAQEAGAAYPETIVALLEPFEQSSGAGTSLCANVNGEIISFEAAVAKTRDHDPVLKPLFQPGGRPDVRKLSYPQYRAIRTTAPQLFGLRPKQ